MLVAILEQSEKAITETLKTYPAGRGKALIIAVRRRPRKRRKSGNPRFTHARVKSNPEDLTIVEYLNDDIKRIVVFPEGRMLQREERLDLAAALIATLPESSNLRPIGVRDKEQLAHNRRKLPHFISRELRKRIERKWLRYRKWRMKQ